ncbi:MAG: M20/M25/M40 family metallo-hydrolase [Dehalococcoidia bacterium]
MIAPRNLGLALALALVATLLLGAAPSSAQEVDVAALAASIDEQRLRDHVAAIDEPRGAFSEPEQLQATADYVQDQLEGFGLPVTLEPVSFADATFPNVIGVHEGALCPERVFVVGAHYDSVADTPGADDDASGVAGMLEIARALSDTPLPATVWFTGFTMEEAGLVGSFNMAMDAEAAGTAIVGMYSLEMIGYTTDQADFVAVIGNEASIRLTDAYRRAQEAYVPALPSVILTLLGNGQEQPDSRRSDHAPFWDAGYQALLVTDTANFRNPNYHEPSDTIETLDFTFATNVTRALLATTVEYLTADADRDGEPDACSGPLSATPTPTSPATPAPAAAPTAATATPMQQAPDAPSELPDTGQGPEGDGPFGPLALLAAVAAALGGWLAWRRASG